MTFAAYRELPVIDARGDYRSAWEQFPAGDNLGCLGKITPEIRRQAFAEALEGTPIGLSLPLDRPRPAMFGRGPLQHTIFAPHRNSLDDRLDNFYPQGTTQWDGLRHIRAREFGFFGGVTAFGEDDDRLGIGHWAQVGVIGRGVLLDVSAKFRQAVANGKQEEDCVIDVADLREAAQVAGVTPRLGDVLCIRTGWQEHDRTLSDERRVALAQVRRWPGLSSSSAMAELLWDWGVAAVAADNPAVEVGPGREADGSLHRRLIPLLGMAMGELFDYEQLAVACEERKRWTFLFVAVPHNLPTGVGSPGNAVAVL